MTVSPSQKRRTCRGDGRGEGLSESSALREKPGRGGGISRWQLLAKIKAVIARGLGAADFFLERVRQYFRFWGHDSALPSQRENAAKDTCLCMDTATHQKLDWQTQAAAASGCGCGLQPLPHLDCESGSHEWRR